MNDRGLREALATLGEPAPAPSADNPWSAQQASAQQSNAPAKPRRWRRLIIIAAIIAVVGTAVYWQREPVLRFAAGLPLVGPLIQNEQPAADQEGADALAVERAALADQQRQLAQRELDISRAEASIYEQSALLQGREMRLEEREQALAEREAAFQESQPGPGIDEVIDIYRNMKANAAAVRLSLLDDLTAITVLKRVDRDHAAKILAAMAPDRAAELSELLAQQGPIP